jgi:hypothetical protein
VKNRGECGGHISRATEIGLVRNEVYIVRSVKRWHGKKADKVMPTRLVLPRSCREPGCAWQYEVAWNPKRLPFLSLLNSNRAVRFEHTPLWNRPTICSCLPVHWSSMIVRMLTSKLARATRVDVFLAGLWYSMQKHGRTWELAFKRYLSQYNKSRAHLAR